MTKATHRVFGLVATVAVIAALVWGFVIIGSPETRRIEKLDERRLSDLRAIVRETRYLVYDPVKGQRRRDVFDDLESLNASARRNKLHLVDPETGEPYGYRVLAPAQYELCATFSMARDSEHDVFWNHPPGRHCWTIDVAGAP